MKTPILTLFLFLPLITAQLRCPSGKFLTPTGCEPCPRGTHRRDDPDLPPDSPCIPCRAGSFSPGLGAWGPDLCRECQPNTYSDTPGSTACKKCPAGTSSRFGATACLTCGPGTQITKDSFKCTKCRKGFYSSENNNQRCKRCPPGMNSPRGAKSKDECVFCLPGQTAIAGFGCTGCFGGSFNPVGNGICKRCPIGTFSKTNLSDSSGPTSCTPCPPGEFQNRKGSSRCKSCKRGDTIGLGNSVCRIAGKKCGKNKFFEDSLGDCRRCPEGYRLNFIKKKCQKCPKGTVSRGGVNTRCIRCKNGQIPDEDNAICACPGGKEIDPNGGCRPCQPGFSQSHINTRCFACWEGTFSDKPGAVRCKRCPFGLVAPEYGSTECVPCPKDTIPHYDRQLRLTSVQCLSDTTNCPVGYLRENIGRFNFRCRKVTCTLNTPPEEVGKTCLSCEPGKRFNVTTGRCQNCASECRSCHPSGSINVCRICTLVESSPGGFATECERCPPGQFQDFKDPSTCSCHGEDGRGFQDGVCQYCAPGTFGQTGKQVCQACPPGTFSDRIGAGGRCEECPVDTFSDEPGATKCRKCPDGMISNFRPGGTKCIPKPV